LDKLKTLKRVYTKYLKTIINAYCNYVDLGGRLYADSVYLSIDSHPSE